MLVSSLWRWRQRAKHAQRVSPLLPMTLALLVALFSCTSAAEIYQWTDAAGNVHFGDKPLDPAVAAKAKTVELKPSYEPVQRSLEEQEIFEAQQKVFRQANDARRSEQEKVRYEEATQRREEKIAYCGKLKKRLTQLSQVAINEKGHRSIYYTRTRDGKAVSVAEQKKILAELREQIDRERC